MNKDDLVKKLNQDIASLLEYDPSKLKDIFYTLYELVEVIEKEKSDA